MIRPVYSCQFTRTGQPHRGVVVALGDTRVVEIDGERIGASHSTLEGALGAHPELITVSTSGDVFDVVETTVPKSTLAGLFRVDVEDVHVEAVFHVNGQEWMPVSGGHGFRCVPASFYYGEASLICTFDMMYDESQEGLPINSWLLYREGDIYEYDDMESEGAQRWYFTSASPIAALEESTTSGVRRLWVPSLDPRSTSRWST